MRATTLGFLFSSFFTVAAISACSGAIQVSPTCDGGACGSDAGGDGGKGQEGDACSTDNDCAAPTRCLYPQPSEESPAGTACGGRGVCKQLLGCGLDCATPLQYMGCDCAGHSVSTCQCPNDGYGPQTYAVVFGAPTTALECPNDPPPSKKDGGVVDANTSDGNDLNVTGSLTVDGQKCSLTAASRQTQSAPDGHTWTLELDATCPVGSLGQVQVFVTGKDNVIYPYGCDSSAIMQLSVGGEGDGGFLAYSGGLAGGSCNVEDGPTSSDQANKVRGSGTLSNGAAKTHTVDIFEP